MQPTKPKKNIRGKIIGLAITIVVALLVWSYSGFISDVATGLFYQPEAEIAKVIEHIDLTDTGSRILRASRPELQQAASFSRSCPAVSADTSTLGCYYQRQIFVYDIDNEELEGIKEAVLAHELLHAVWDRLSDNERKELEPVLRQIYSENEADLSEHMSSYEAEDYVDELHSVIGTQLDTSKLGSRLREHYAKYFNDIDRIVSYFSAYDEILTGQRKQANAMYDEIIALKAEIERRSTAYEQENQKLSNDIDDYNARASHGYTTIAERDAFEAERNQLITRQNLQQQEYNALVQLVNSANQKVDEYNQLVEHLGELMRSIDSTSVDDIPKAESLSN